jgi:hypothetical protein
MPLGLAELREVEYDLHQRFNRIEAGMNILMEFLLTINMADKSKVRSEWKQWKGKRLINYDPRTKEYDL